METRINLSEYQVTIFQYTKDAHCFQPMMHHGCTAELPWLQDCTAWMRAYHCSSSSFRLYTTDKCHDIPVLLGPSVSSSQKLQENICLTPCQNSNVWGPNMACLNLHRTHFLFTCPLLDPNDGIKARRFACSSPG